MKQKDYSAHLIVENLDFRVFFGESRPLDVRADSATADPSTDAWSFRGVALDIPDTQMTASADHARWDSTKRHLLLEGGVAIRLPDAEFTTETLLLDLDGGVWLAGEGLRLRAEGMQLGAARGGGHFEASSRVWLEGVNAHLGENREQGTKP